MLNKGLISGGWGTFWGGGGLGWLEITMKLPYSQLFYVVFTTILILLICFFGMMEGERWIRSIWTLKAWMISSLKMPKTKLEHHRLENINFFGELQKKKSVKNRQTNKQTNKQTTSGKAKEIRPPNLPRKYEVFFLFKKIVLTKGGLLKWLIEGRHCGAQGRSRLSFFLRKQRLMGKKD